MKYNFFTNLQLSLKRQGVLMLSGVFGIVLDQLLKYTARTNPEDTYYVIERILGWEYFENTGIAFGIPIPHIIVIPLTIAIIIAGIYYIKKSKTDSLRLFASSLIIAGALSNLIDRIIFGFTVDYIRIITSIINLADVMVLGGVVLLFLNGNRNESKAGRT